MTKTSKVDTKIGEDGDAIAILGSLFQRLITLTFKKNIFLLLQVQILYCFVLLDAKALFLVPGNFPL